MKNYPTTLAIGDAHFPLVKWRTVDAILKIVSEVKPKQIIQMGDLYDFYSFSRFPRTHDLFTPMKEVELGRRDAERFWKEIRKAAPKADLYQLIGNHDVRPKKRILEKAPEFASLVTKGLSGLWDFPTVTTIPSDREELILQGVVYHHGWRRHGDHVVYNLMPTVVAHLHTGGSVFRKIRGEVLWELNAGFIANASALPMSYGPQAKFRKETLGLGHIDKYGPRFICLE